MSTLRNSWAGLSLMAVLASGPAVAAELAWGTTQSAPAGTRAELFGVAAAAPDDIWAVGGFNPGEPPTAVLTRPYAEHWDGTGWVATPVPLGQVYAAQLVKLLGAAANGPGDAWAVGHVEDVGSLAARTLAYRWNGSQWLRVATPNPAPAGEGDRLQAVASRGAGEAWAVGSTRYPAQSLVMRWNGAQWRLRSTPNIGPLVAVHATDTMVTAAGLSRLMQTKDGRTWTVLPEPPPAYPPGYVQLSGVAAKGGRLWVVGSVTRPNGEGYTIGPYAAFWRQAAWTFVPVNAAAGGLTGVAASAGAVWATSFDGKAFKLTAAGVVPQVMPAPGAVVLNAVTVDPLGQPWAVGALYGDGGPAPALVNAPGIGQGGIRVTTGFAQAAVTWIGPVTGSGTADSYGQFSVSGLPAGSYQVIASGNGCSPGLAQVDIAAGAVSAVTARVEC